ncbi:MAG: hypothetical protein IT208_10170 [Chthonomonadales bacterium]|nr:hypothetical protein [Chthonomonadales bacterium]
MLLGITLLWTVSAGGIVRIAPAATMLGSGLVMLLPFLPPPVSRVAGWPPFPGIADAPYRLYTGDLPTGAHPGVLLHQASRTVALVLVGRWVLARGVRRLVALGGGGAPCVSGVALHPAASACPRARRAGHTAPGQAGAVACRSTCWFPYP